MQQELVAEVKKNDPVRGHWDVNGLEARAWVDASFFALGAAVVVGGYTVDDASWLHKVDQSHQHARGGCSHQRSEPRVGGVGDGLICSASLNFKWSVREK